MEISRDEYLREVTEADPESFVVLHLYETSNEFCLLINQHLPDVAKRFGHVKFVKIIATKCIENFIIYKAGKPVSNMTNVDRHMKGDIRNIDILLGSHGIHPF
jgi:hypothetical protein